MQLTIRRYLVTYDADEDSAPEKLREKLSEYGKVKYISRSVYVILSKEELNVQDLFDDLSYYINESITESEKLFVAHVGRTHPLLDSFDTLD